MGRSDRWRKRKYFNIFIGVAMFILGLYLYNYFDVYLWNNIDNIGNTVKVLRTAKIINYSSYALMIVGGIISIKNIWKVF